MSGVGAERELSAPLTKPAAERGEHWWPVALAILVTALLHAVLPGQYRVQPQWIVPVVLIALLAALIIGDPWPHRPATALAADRHWRRHHVHHAGELVRCRPSYL